MYVYMYKYAYINTDACYDMEKKMREYIRSRDAVRIVDVDELGGGNLEENKG